ncbi:MAG: AsmA family protein [Hyphomicrobiaceae bacterium]
MSTGVLFRRVAVDPSIRVRRGFGRWGVQATRRVAPDHGRKREERAVNTVLMWIGGLLAAVLAALFAVPYFIDWNGYRGVIEEEATRILGREVRVGGKINVRLLPTPYLRFEKLRIADTRLGASEPLFRAESFTIWLSVPPLLQGNLEARHVALQEPVVTLGIEKDGTGNWTTLGIRPGTLPFVPQNVALQAVDINSGTVVLQHPRAGEVGRLTGITGVISAEALDGPYKFGGDVELAGASRDVRIATAKADPDGTIRFKAAANPKGTIGTIYKLEGSLTGFSGRPEISGSLSATLPLPELPAATNGAPTANGAIPGGSVYADVKGRMLANADQLEIKEVVASIENVGQPQLLTGDMTLEWGRLRRLDFEIASRWLDLDRLAGATGRASPVGTSAVLIDGLIRALPEQSATRGVVSIDQMTLGGAPLAKLDLAVSRLGTGSLRIERLFAELPAGARIALDGVLQKRGEEAEFDGTVTGAGPSLARLAQWGMPGQQLGMAAPDGAFTLDSHLNVGRRRMALQDVRAVFADHELSGSVVLENGGPLSVEVVAETFESDWLWSGGLTRTAAMGWIDRIVAGATAVDWGGQAKADAKVKPAKEGAKAVRGLDFKLTTGVLRGPDRALRDVVADISMADGELRLKRLAFRGGDGLDVNLNGHIGRKDGKPVGLVNGVLGAMDSKALETAVAVFDMPESERIRQLRDMLPLRLAGRIALGQRMVRAVDVMADGSAMHGRISFKANLDGGLADDWRAMPAEFTLSGDDLATARLMALIFARAPGADAGGARDGMRANVAIKAVGVPEEGLVTDAALSREGLSLAYNGRATIAADTVPKLSGTAEVAADRLGDVLALVGVPSNIGGGSSVTGTLGLSFEDDGRTKLTPSGLTVAGSEVTGTLRVARGDGGRIKVDGEIAIDQATVAGLLGGVVQSAPRPVPVSAADLAFQEGQGPWTDQPFADAGFERFEGNVMLQLKHLGVAPGLGVSSARLGLKFVPGQIDVSLIEAGMLGGSLRGNVVLAKAAAGARVKGELEAAGVEISAIARGAASSIDAGGTASLTVAFSGQALSPRSLITALRGSGRMNFVDAWVGGMAPEIVNAIITRAFQKEIDTEGRTLEAELLKSLGTGRLAIGHTDVGVEIADGVLRIAKMETRGESGRVETLVTVDLSKLQAETEWRLIAGARAPGKPAWPPVSIYYTGSLGSLATITPRVALGSFERELTVRRMEYEVEELERLRKLDEERARLERERQKALAEAARQERERQRALEAERLRQQFEQQQRTLTPQLPGPRSDVPAGADPAAGSPEQAADGGGAAPAGTVDTQQGSAVLEPAAAPGEPGAGAQNGGGETSGAVGAQEAAPVAPQPRPVVRERRSPRRAPNAGETLMRSLNPGYIPD